MNPLSPPLDLPSPPFLPIEGIPNFRDIGGLPLPSGQKVKSHVLFRSADPSHITPAGLSQLSALGITTVFDLRSTPEIQRQGKEWAGTPVVADPFASSGGTGVARRWTPVFADADYSPEAVALRFRAYADGTEGFVRAYAEILAHGGRAFAEVVRALAGGEGAVLVHCTAGKDRTGCLVAVVLLLLGVGEGEVSREYALTDLGLAGLKELYRERLLATEALRGNEEGVERMITSREENMRDTIKMIGERWGGVRGYVRDVLGLTEEEVKKLRTRFGVEE